MICNALSKRTPSPNCVDSPCARHTLSCTTPCSLTKWKLAENAIPCTKSANSSETRYLPIGVLTKFRTPTVSGVRDPLVAQYYEQTVSSLCRQDGTYRAPQRRRGATSWISQTTAPPHLLPEQSPTTISKRAIFEAHLRHTARPARCCNVAEPTPASLPYSI